MRFTGCVIYMSLKTVKIMEVAWHNLRLFINDKQPGDDIFDQINPTKLNEYLSSLMPGLTAKVFRTFNASKTLQDKLNESVEKYRKLLQVTLLCRFISRITLEKQESNISLLSLL